MNSYLFLNFPKLFGYLLYLPCLFKTCLFNYASFFLLIIEITVAVLRVFKMFTCMKISPSAGYTWMTFGSWGNDKER